MIRTFCINLYYNIFPVCVEAADNALSSSQRITYTCTIARTGKLSGNRMIVVQWGQLGLETRSCLLQRRASGRARARTLCVQYPQYITTNARRTRRI